MRFTEEQKEFMKRELGKDLDKLDSLTPEERMGWWEAVAWIEMEEAGIAAEHIDIDGIPADVSERGEMAASILNLI